MIKWLKIYLIKRYLMDIPDREADCTACSEKEASRSRRID